MASREIISVRSVVSVVSVLGNKKGHTELTELTEKVASREIISVVPVWVKKVTRNSQNSRKGWHQKEISVRSVVSVWGNKKGHTELTELTEKVASREIISVRSVVSVWGNKKSHGTRKTHGRKG